uniref:H15 domain-containing protein n=1 Tax=Solanum lycopersicum TaxID=4081 RepID=A0A3Q7ISN9_SOLLC
MDKLREGIVKMSNSEPNASLSESQNSTTPNYRPYAQMIEQALQELDEEEGSDEDSISKFIIKNNDTLTRDDKIMLKHHL